MKIVIFSDSHGDVETMRSVVEKERPDLIIYLGDGIADAEQLNRIYPSIKMIAVLGNVDSDKEENWIKHAEICGRHFVITHGHTFINEFKDHKQTDEDRLKSRRKMLAFMKENDADIFLHGHTHEPYMNRTQITPEKTCWIMNPGSIRRKDGGFMNPVYGVLKLNESGISEWQFIEIK